MTTKEKVIVRIFQEYRKRFSTTNSDSELAKEIAKVDCFDLMQEDLMELCEDNDEMRQQIKKFFEDNES